MTDLNPVDAMTTDYRAMCAELLSEAIYLGSVPSAFPPSPELVARARALLEQPEPPELTDQEIASAAREALDSYRYSTELPYFLEEHASEREPIMLAFRAAIAADRAAIAKYGTPTPQPVAVSERLPGPEDCDEKGRCWWHRYTPTKEWHLQRVYIGRYNYWLPANALPTPELEALDD